VQIGGLDRSLADRSARRGRPERVRDFLDLVSYVLDDGRLVTPMRA
jgi:hypothetical protein